MASHWLTIVYNDGIIAYNLEDNFIRNVCIVGITETAWII